MKPLAAQFAEVVLGALLMAAKQQHVALAEGKEVGDRAVLVGVGHSRRDS